MQFGVYEMGLFRYALTGFMHVGLQPILVSHSECI